MVRNLLVVIMLCFAIQASAFAAGKNKISQSDFYIGGGVSSNDIGGGWDDSTGFQFFAGFKLPISLANATHSVEVGYMDSGEFDKTIWILGTPIKEQMDAQGLWSTYTFIWPVSDSVNLIGRGGLDIGDDDGIMIGGGVEFDFDSAITLRLEYVMRDNIDSLQFNLAYQL